MNFESIDIRDLVLIGGGLFTVAIILHGIWLTWRSRRQPLRLDISPELVPDVDDDMARYRGELPNGGGRLVDPMQKTLDFEHSPQARSDPAPSRASMASDSR